MSFPKVDILIAFAFTTAPKKITESYDKSSFTASQYLLGDVKELNASVISPWILGILESCKFRFR